MMYCVVFYSMNIPMFFTKNRRGGYPDIETKEYCRQAMLLAIRSHCWNLQRLIGLPIIMHPVWF